MYHGKLFWYDSPKLYKEEVNDISAYLILADDWEIIKNNEIKSQDDLNTQGRESDILTATIMKCQELVKEKVELENENKRLRELINRLGSNIDELDIKNKVLLAEVNSLRGLLKDVKEFIEEENPKDYTIMSERMDELLTKIEEALK